MTTNADRTRDVLLNNFDNATAEISALLDAKDQRIVELEAELAATQAELERERGLPI